MMTPTMNYKKWLTAASEYWSISEEDILNTRIRRKVVANARLTFYTLCLRDKICLYDLARRFGTYRTCIWQAITRTERDVSNHVKTIINDSLNSKP